MSYLLMPEDEREFVANLIVERGLKLLLDDLAPGREPHIAKDPMAALPSELPRSPSVGVSDVTALLFWSPEAGEVVTLGDPGRSVDAVSRIGLAMSQQSAGGRWRQVIDQDRSPLIRWRRCFWRDNGHLSPGLLQGLAAPTSRWPPELLRVHHSIERWLRKDSVRLDPFEHCDDPPVVPNNRSQFVVWARPTAAAWVQSGGRVWPWTA